MSYNGIPGLCKDGTFSYTHDGSETPEGVDDFSYRVTDEDGFSSTAKVTVTVNPINDCPRADNATFTVNEAESIEVDLTLGITDAEYVLGLDPVLNFELLASPSRGTIDLSPSGILKYTAPQYVTGSDPLFVYFTYKVTDGGNCDATEDVEITINNTVPEAVADTFTVTVGGTINISAALGVLANDPIPAGASAESSIVK